MEQKTMKNLLFITITMLFISAIFTLPVFASSIDGTIDSTYKYAWGENIGWINFGANNGNVHVADSGLSGYALAENIGWIYLGNITNNGEGTLSGYAWGENAGWIKFNPTNGGVVINSSGEFTGSALGENIGWIIFGGDYKVKTDWRPASSRTTATATVSGGGGRAHLPKIAEPEKPTLAQETIDRIRKEAQRISEKAREIAEQIAKVFLPIKPPITEKIKPPEIPIEELVPKETPLAFQGKWQLLPPKPIREFVLAPLPKEIRKLAEKFPELEKTFEEVGITKITDIVKLKAIRLTLPGLTEKVGPEGVPLGGTLRGKIALPKGLPIAKLSPQMKQQLPTEIVFAKTGGELIDFNIALSVTEKGEPEQKITTISGKPLQLVVKPDKPVKSVKGYVVWKQKNPKSQTLNPKQIPITKIQNSKLFGALGFRNWDLFRNSDLEIRNSEFRLDSLLGSIFFALPSFAKEHNPTEIETRLVLLEFEYADPDGDGIYTAEIQAPIAEGEYEIITVMDFEDPELGTKEIRLITVVDPEGYIYEKDGDKETRIPGAIVSLFWLNPETKQYEVWPAKEYQQENPQTTDVRGAYSFLAPEGFYYLKVEAPGYLVYDGKPFQVKEGSGVHFNIELKTKYWWLKVVDWKTILLIALILLLLYNFYRDRVREKLQK